MLILLDDLSRPKPAHGAGGAAGPAAAPASDPPPRAPGTKRRKLSGKQPVTEGAGDPGVPGEAGDPEGHGPPSSYADLFDDAFLGAIIFDGVYAGGDDGEAQDGAELLGGADLLLGEISHSATLKKCLDTISPVKLEAILKGAGTVLIYFYFAIR